MIKSYLFLSAAAGARAAGDPPGGDPFRHSGEQAARRVAELDPRVVGYAQTRTLAAQIDPEAEPPYLGVAELWFEDAAHAPLTRDQAQAYAPLWRSQGVALGALLTGHERVVMRLPVHHLQPCIKGVFPFRRKTGLDVRAFQHHWWHRHGPIAAQTEQALCYVQCHPLAACYRDGDPRYDGVTELHWRDVAAARSAMASRQMREDQGGDARNFVEADSVELFLAESEAVIPA